VRVWHTDMASRPPRSVRLMSYTGSSNLKITVSVSLASLLWISAAVNGRNLYNLLYPSPHNTASDFTRGVLIPIAIAASVYTFAVGCYWWWKALRE